MGLMYTSVIGLAVCLGMSAGFIMHYLSKAMPASDSVVIDPKPDTKF